MDQFITLLNNIRILHDKEYIFKREKVNNMELYNYSQCEEIYERDYHILLKNRFKLYHDLKLFLRNSNICEFYRVRFQALHHYKYDCIYCVESCIEHLVTFDTYLIIRNKNPKDLFYELFPKIQEEFGFVVLQDFEIKIDKIDTGKTLRYIINTEYIDSYNINRPTLLNISNIQFDKLIDTYGHFREEEGFEFENQLDNLTDLEEYELYRERNPQEEYILDFEKRMEYVR